MTDDELPPPHELEQLARSLSMDGALGRHDAQVVADVLRWVARQRVQERGDRSSPRKTQPG
ncbi:MAG: hypothetical protein R8G01_01335 [Ilumatobacteraceae bacterium]|nr:hypothetical protein [Ilumatobacteraceae bacterium]